ncbi:MAG: glycosyltransferase family 2 protein [Bacteroidaceae bacterium]|nr:glycosyltransferase family 2 protein [Bacteroidaceae bacterium]
MPVLSVVIVNYNVKYYLEQCLESVRRASQGLQVEVFVVDNLSTDGSVPYLRERFPEVTFIENNENVGFARANNQAIRQSRGEYVLLLNPDTILCEDTLRRFVDFMDAHPEAGAAGAYMLHADGTFAPESRRGLPTPFVAFCKMSGLTRLFPKSRLFGRYYMGYLDVNEVNRIEAISGACMMLRREALDRVGLLDEDFFMYGEDIDLSYRILQGGYHNYFLPVRMLHYKGESTVKNSYRYVYTFYQAMRLFFRKHYSHYSWVISLPINLAIWASSFMTYVANRLRYRKKRRGTSLSLNALVIGQHPMLAEVRELLEKHHPEGNHRFVEASGAVASDGHLVAGVDLTAYDTVVYDVGCYSYGDILRLLEQTPGNVLRLGTYSTSTKVLITDRKVYK